MELDMTAKTLEDMVFFHVLFVTLFPLAFLSNLYTLFTYKTYRQALFRLWLVMPLIFLLIAMGCFSGMFIMAMLQWIITWRIMCMLALMGLIMGCELARIRRQKLAKTSRLLMHKYIIFCRYIYALELILVLGFFISYI